MSDTQKPPVGLKAAIVQVTPFQQNCSLIWDDVTKKGAIIDPGGDLDHIEHALQQVKFTVEKIILTHGHIDHAGGAKELKEKGVLTKEGGVVGIGAVNKLNTEGLSKDQFTVVDVTATPEIAIGAKKAKLATSHPASSYRLEDGTRLVITDADKFWSVSKYLVIVVEQ